MHGKALTEWRRAAQMSQLELAHCIGVCQKTVSQWEQGRNGPRDHNESRLMAAINSFDIYGPGSYAWDCADRIESGYMTIDRALHNAPTTYNQKALASWLADVANHRVHV